MFTRSGTDIWEVDISTGEILGEYIEEKPPKYKTPKPKVDDSALSSLEELKAHCSDSSREQRGNDGYFIDFQMRGDVTLSDVRVWKVMATDCLIHSYTIARVDSLVETLPLDRKTILRSLKKLETLKLIRKVNDHFYHEDTRYTLYWLHPLTCFKGSYWKHRAACRELLNTYEEG